MSSTLEAKIVVLGAQGVGKTSLVMRYCKGTFVPSQITSTVGASFLTKRVVDTDTDTLVRLQIWDTAGQERFRSISRLYYRGANACILCYSITDAKSFDEMGTWLTELRRNLPADIVLHVVGTKADIVARDPSRREVPFERCIAYVAEHLAPGRSATPPPTTTATATEGRTSTGGFFSNFGVSVGSSSDHHHHTDHHRHHHNQPTPHHSNPNLLTTTFPCPPATSGGGQFEPLSPSSKRSSGFWGQEAGWDACHEISAESGEGVDEVFRVVTRKLVEQNRRMQAALLAATGSSAGGPDYLSHSIGASGGGAAGVGGEDGYYGYYGHLGGGGGGSSSGGGGDYFRGRDIESGGSFRVGRDRRSWLFNAGFSPVFTPGSGGPVSGAEDVEDGGRVRQRVGRGSCC
ncbi:hypothetical protein VTJ04DRAFT_4635 [Mycothermus thermophilus]|uniref:uncharacterized protein n=1 Tax=Humicola insolens TaxID=85995 RepID=UPI003743E2C0